MKLAVITPTAELKRRPPPDHLHMVLAHLLSGAYLDYYFDRGHAGSGWLILDNATYERQQPISPSELLRRACGINANEIVVPDKMGDMEQTLGLAGEAFDVWSSRADAARIAKLKPRLLLTPQGSTLEEWRSCLFGLIMRWSRFVRGNPELHQQGEATIGVSTKVVSGLVDRGVDLVLEKWLWDLHRNYGYEVHLFGVLGAFKLWDLNRIARDFPFVRSVDTVKPIVYAMNGVELDVTKPEPRYPHRPADYFERRLNERESVVASNNITTVWRLAAGDYARVGPGE